MRKLIVKIFYLQLVSGYVIRLVPYCESQKITGAPLAQFINKKVSKIQNSIEGKPGMVTNLAECAPLRNDQKIRINMPRPIIRTPPLVTNPPPRIITPQPPPMVVPRPVIPPLQPHFIPQQPHFIPQQPHFIPQPHIVPQPHFIPPQPAFMIPQQRIIRPQQPHILPPQQPFMTQMLRPVQPNMMNTPFQRPIMMRMMPPNSMPPVQRIIRMTKPPQNNQVQSHKVINSQPIIKPPVKPVITKTVVKPPVKVETPKLIKQIVNPVTPVHKSTKKIIKPQLAMIQKVNVCQTPTTGQKIVSYCQTTVPTKKTEEHSDIQGEMIPQEESHSFKAQVQKLTDNYAELEIQHARHQQTIIPISTFSGKEESTFISIRNLCNMSITPFFIECDPYKLHTLSIKSQEIRFNTDVINEIVMKGGMQDEEIIKKSTGITLQELRRLNRAISQIYDQAYRIKDGERIFCTRNYQSSEYICVKVKCVHGVCDEPFHLVETQFKKGKENSFSINLPDIADNDTFVRNTITIETTKTKQDDPQNSQPEEYIQPQYKKSSSSPYIDFSEPDIADSKPDSTKHIRDFLNNKKINSKIFYKDREKNEIYDVVSSESETDKVDHCNSSSPYFDTEKCIKVVKMSDLIKGNYFDPCLELFKNKIDNIGKGNFAYCSLMEPQDYMNGDSMLYLSEIL